MARRPAARACDGCGRQRGVRAGLALVVVVAPISDLSLRPAAAWPVRLRARLRHPARRGAALAAVSGGLVIAMAALGIAAAAHWLRGPTLLGRGSVPAEEVLLAVAAALWGWRVAERRRRAWFLPAEAARE